MSYIGFAKKKVAINTHLEGRSVLSMAVSDRVQFYAALLQLEAVVFVSIMAAAHAVERRIAPSMLYMEVTV